MKKESSVDDVPLHRLYRHFSELPYSMRVLYTATLLILGTALAGAAAGRGGSRFA